MNSQRIHSVEMFGSTEYLMRGNLLPVCKKLMEDVVIEESVEMVERGFLEHRMV